MKVYSTIWNNYPGHTDISKYLLVRFYQLLDSGEVITNRHPAMNGIILLEEILFLSDGCIERWKNNNRLKFLLSECNDKKIDTSIANDYILNQYFPSIISQVKSWNMNEVSIDSVRAMKIYLSLNYNEIKKKYIYYLRTEIDNIDYSNDHFDVETHKIEKLLSILASQLLREGFSLNFLQRSAKSLIRYPPPGLSNAIIQRFVDSIDKPNSYIIYIPSATNLPDDIMNRLDNREEITLNQNDFDDDIEDNLLDGYKFNVSGLDPFAALQFWVVNTFKKSSVKNQSLDEGSISDFLDSVYYYHGSPEKYYKYNYADINDPTVPKTRHNTMEYSLSKLNIFLSDIPDRIFDHLIEPFYFYNLAMKTPSIENSFILLWTALESSMGLKSQKSDIETIQFNVAKPIAIGSIGRRVNSIVQRIRTTGKAYNWPYIGPNGENTSEFEKEGLTKWIYWLSSQDLNNTSNDPYATLKNEPLLCKQYRSVNESWNKIKVLKKIIEISELKISYQLDRLYLIRNRIVHSGKHINSIENLWIHLEWYVAKVIVQSLLTLMDIDGETDNFSPKDAIFSVLILQSQSSLDYLNIHKEDSISVEHIKNSGIVSFLSLCF